MQPLSQEHRDSFLKKKSYALSLFDENTTVEEILKKIYIENMESKSEMQAEVMAQNVIETIVGFAGEQAFKVLGLEHSPVKGPEGNIEYLMYLEKSDKAEDVSVISETIKELVTRSHQVLDK